MLNSPPNGSLFPVWSSTGRFHALLTSQLGRAGLLHTAVPEKPASAGLKWGNSGNLSWENPDTVCRLPPACSHTTNPGQPPALMSWLPTAWAAWPATLPPFRGLGLTSPGVPLASQRIHPRVLSQGYGTQVRNEEEDGEWGAVTKGSKKSKYVTCVCQCAKMKPTTLYN